MLQKLKDTNGAIALKKASLSYCSSWITLLCSGADMGTRWGLTPSLQCFSEEQL